jgi:hypothetical protein
MTRDWLLERGWAVVVGEVETPAAARSSSPRKAAKKIADGLKRLF